MRTETTFHLVGDLIGVDAMMVGPTGSAEVTLILDTAAAMTTVVPSVAQSIGYTSDLRLGWSITRTAAARLHGYPASEVQRFFEATRVANAFNPPTTFASRS